MKVRAEIGVEKDSKIYDFRCGTGQTLAVLKRCLQQCDIGQSQIFRGRLAQADGGNSLGLCLQYPQSLRHSFRKRPLL